MQDPAGHWVELVIVPGASADALARFEIGLAVADPDRSRAFYRDVMGLDVLEPLQNPSLSATMYGFRHGSVTVRVWAAKSGAARDAQTGGMQYIVWNVSGVNDVAVSRGATIDRPLSAPGQMRTVWLLDPDGISNYFAQYRRQRQFTAEGLRTSRVIYGVISPSPSSGRRPARTPTACPRAGRWPWRVPAR